MLTVRAGRDERFWSGEDGDVYPALRHRTRGVFDAHADRVRRELWRAYQRGALTDDEFARTLDRLEVEQPA